MKKLLLLLLLFIPFNVRAESSDLYLQDLFIEGYEISPKFDKYNNLYTLIITSDISNLEINATPEKDGTIIITEGNNTLGEGENNIYVKITNTDETEENIYQIIVTIENDTTPAFLEYQRKKTEVAPEKEEAKRKTDGESRIFSKTRGIFPFSKNFCET